MDPSGKQKFRIVIDYRKLNEKTIDDKFPILHISDILDQLGTLVHCISKDILKSKGFAKLIKTN